MAFINSQGALIDVFCLPALRPMIANRWSCGNRKILVMVVLFFDKLPLSLVTYGDSTGERGIASRARDVESFEPF